VHVNQKNNAFIFFYAGYGDGSLFKALPVKALYNSIILFFISGLEGF
jgi:hypothetical protein